MTQKKTKIALGMSGGVDSSVSAEALMRDGYEVVGITCIFVDDEKSRSAVADAASVAEKLNIEHHAYDCTERFECQVIQPFVDEYAQGLTPSPCVDCNAGCKIPSLIKAADEFGCEKISTGHYARITQVPENDRYVVKTALDTTKDQSYMLAMLNQDQLSRMILPLGTVTKKDVRSFAHELDLPVADKEESQDICFVDDSHLDFLLTRGVQGKPGPIVDRDNKVLGKHEGLERYTIGQRKGIGIGGAPEPYYVLEKRAKSNELVVGFKDEATMSCFAVGAINWVAFEDLKEPIECMAKVRYRSKPVLCKVEPTDDGALVALQRPQALTSPGQYCVFYQGDILLGGAPIAEIYHDDNICDQGAL